MQRQLAILIEQQGEAQTGGILADYALGTGGGEYKQVWTVPVGY